MPSPHSYSKMHSEKSAFGKIHSCNSIERPSKLNLTYSMMRVFEQYYLFWRLTWDEKFDKQVLMVGLVH